MSIDINKFHKVAPVLWRARDSLLEAQREFGVAELNYDALVQEGQTRDQLASVSVGERSVGDFDPQVYDALSPRNIRYIVTGE